MGILSVIQKQWKRFVIEKGMLFFYAVSILLAGAIVPYFVQDFQTSFSIIVILTIMVSKPILADSVASEREKKTLESILSSPITIREYLMGKVTFCLLFSSVFFTLCNILFVIACKRVPIANISSEFVLVEWYLSVMVVLLLTTVSGVYKSARSENMHVAQNKITVTSYPFIVVLIVYFEVTNLNLYEATIGINVLFYIITGALLEKNVKKIMQMYHSDFYEGVFGESKHIEHSPAERGLLLGNGDFMVVIQHEMKYMKTLKTLNFCLLLNFIGPAAMLLVGYYYTGECNMVFPVLTMAMMIPKIPTSYVAYSVGGEKTYKIGESLLSTPLNVSTMFLGKTVLPNIISAFTIIVSTLLVILVYSYVENVNAVESFSATTWILMIPASMLSSIIMTFLTAILSFTLKTPRQAYFATIYGGYLFMVPNALILFVASNQLLWSFVYLVVLLISVFVMFLFVRKKINRPLLVSKL